MTIGLLKKKIYYHDTDCGGVVYYANYLKHLEEGRTEFCLENGINTQEYARQGVWFVVANIEVTYRAPARYGETVTVETRVEKVGRTSIVFKQRILRDAKLLIESTVVWVCVNTEFKPRSVPEEFSRLVSAA